jgi:hypothetical protein
MVKEIFEGYRNWIKNSSGTLNHTITVLARQRLQECSECPLQSYPFCSVFKMHEGIRGCGCFIMPKAFSPDSKCPLGKWEKISV